MQDKLEQYAQISLYIRELETELEKLKEEIFPALKTVGEAVRIPDGTFSVMNRSTWKFSDEYKEVESKSKADLKALQQAEIDSGRATKEESQSLVFRPISEAKLGERRIIEMILNNRDQMYKN